MKQLFCILSVAALIATGCQKRASEAAADVEGNQLTVNASVDGVPVAQTRAAGTDVDLKTHGFYLAGYHTTGQMATDLANAYPNVFNKEVGDQQVSVPLVTYTANGNGGKFVLKTIKWALDDITYLSFFGWSQSKLIPTSGVTTATTGIIGQTKDDNDKGYPWIDIRNADAPADQTDVVGSRSLDHKNDAVVSAVDLDFRHLLTKLTFKAKSSSGANVAITAVNIKYATNKVRKKARYTFGSEAATIGAFGDFDEYHSGTVALNTTYPAVTNGAEAILGSALLIPQQLAEGDVSIEIKYQVSPNSGDLTGSEQTKTLPLAAFTFEQGNNYLYVIDIQAAEVFVPSYPIITNWDVITSNQLPVVAGPMDGNTLLLLDGYDKPYTHTDGKAYWLDRSGYNNHCEIVGYDPAMYSAAEHTYTFNNSPDRYLKVPLLRSVTALTVSVIAQQTPGTNGNQTLINLENGTSNTRPFFTHMGYNGSTTVYFDTGASNVASGRLSYNVSSTSVFDQRTLWTFQKQDRGMQRIYQNAVLKAEVSTTSTVSLSALSGQLCSSYAGEVSYVRVVGALQPAADMVADYQEQKKRFNIVEPTNPYLPPVTDELVFCFDGRSGVETINGVSYWRDQVSRNDAKILMPDKVSLSGNHFVIRNPDALMAMQLIYGVPLANNYTMQIISATPGEILNWRQKAGDQNTRILTYYYSGGKIYCNSPISDGFQAPWDSGTFGDFGSFRQVTVRRNYNTYFQMWTNNRLAIDKGSDNADTDISSSVIEEMGIGYKVNGGSIYMLRLYNRVLTEQEMSANWEYDKRTFGLTD